MLVHRICIIFYVLLVLDLVEQCKSRIIRACWHHTVLHVTIDVGVPFLSIYDSTFLSPIQSFRVLERVLEFYTLL